MSFDLICMGEPMLEFNQAEGTLYRAGHGGDTSNTAVAAARQGARVAYMTAIGDDPAGQSFLELWQAEGIATEGVVLDRTRPTAVYMVHHGPQGHAFHYYRHGSAASAYGPAQVDEALVRRGRMFYASGISLAISTQAADAVFHAIDVARGAGASVALDSNYRPLLWPPARASALIHAAMAQSQVALPGLEDARALTGLEDPDTIIDFYLRLGPELVALKMGAQGTMLATPSGRCTIPPFPCTPVDATGAGDTFCGAFLARLAAGDPAEAAARYGACAAALSTAGYGAVPPIPDAAAVRAAMAAPA